jgi:chromate reductase
MFALDKNHEVIMRTLNFTALTNSLRPNSLNRKVMSLVEELLPPHITIKWANPSALPFYDPDLEKQGIPKTIELFFKQFINVDGVIISCPEYNHSIPAALKNSIDWLSRSSDKPLDGMPVMILSATTGLLGGARMQYDLRRVLDAVGAFTLQKPEVFIGNADSKFDLNDRCTDIQTRSMVERQLQAFEAWVCKINPTSNTIASNENKFKH